MSRKYAPPFATLASVQNAGGGACMRDATISLAITPPPSDTDKARPHCRWGMRAGRFREVAGVSIIDVGSSRSQ